MKYGETKVALTQINKNTTRINPATIFQTLLTLRRAPHLCVVLRLHHVFSNQEPGVSSDAAMVASAGALALAVCTAYAAQRGEWAARQRAPLTPTPTPTLTQTQTQTHARFFDPCPQKKNLLDPSQIPN
jgi:hypothetical protein